MLNTAPDKAPLSAPSHFSAALLYAERARDAVAVALRGTPFAWFSFFGGGSFLRAFARVRGCVREEDIGVRADSFGSDRRQLIYRVRR